MRYATGLLIRLRSFSTILPVAELALWMALVLMPTAVTVYRLARGARGSNYTRLQFGQVEQIVPRAHWLSFALERVSYQEWQTVAAINLPGMVIEVVISLPLSWPSTWRPAGMSFYSWRTISYPFFCLPAWWLVGRGLDGLFRRVRLSWLMLLIGSILCALCLFVLLGFRFGLSPQDRAGMRWPMWGLGLWGLGFGVLPAAWLRQSFAARRKRMAPTPASS